MARPRTRTNPTTTKTRTKAPRPLAVESGEIARRAYDLFIARGRAHGHDVDDWLQAERELTEATMHAGA